MKARNPETGNFETVYVKALDSMPVGTQVEYTGSTIPVGWEEVNDYSTSEVNTGKKWIGKPIYRKVYTNDDFALNNNATLQHNIANIDLICDWNGVMKINTNPDIFYQNFAYFRGSNYSFGIQSVSKTEITFTTASDTGNLPHVSIWMAIEYTKTTD